MDPYKVITLVIMAAFVAMIAGLYIEWLLDRDDDDPWLEPEAHHYDDRESWER